jgi:predicted metal-dependent phosphoesterase TrpH
MENKEIHKKEKPRHLGRADLHIHSNYSDGRPSIEEILDYVENHTRLDVIAITDHDSIEGALVAQAIMKTKKYRFELIIGEEITSKEGHILGLYLKEAIPAGLPTHTVLKKIKEQDGVSVASHPFMHTRWRNPNIRLMDGVGLFTLIKEKAGFNAIEIVNATPTLQKVNLQASFVNHTLLFCGETGSSDAHIVEAIGRGYTLFEGKTAADLKRALRYHQTKAEYGKWSFLALYDYLFFFIPKGFRMAIHTLLHGRTPERPQIVNIPEK